MSRQKFVAFAIVVLAQALLAGCASLNAQPPVEAFANKLADQAIIPAIKEGLTQGVEQLSIQAGAQGINPTYVVGFEGKWVVGIEGRASVGVEGVAGQMQVSSSSNEKTRTSPHAKDVQKPPATQPAAEEGP
jgi:outer membrane murein-binding lipoprotein Lpp